MDVQVERAWERYRRSVVRNARKAQHLATRNTILTDSDLECGDNETLVWLLEEMLSDMALANKLPARELSETVTFVFHPSRLGHSVQRYTFPGGVSVTRRTKKPHPTYTVLGRASDGRELWLTIIRQQQGYLLARKHFAGSNSLAEISEATPGASYVNGTRIRHGQHGHE